MTYDQLREKLEMIKDPSFDKPFKEVAGIKKLTIGPTGVVECEIYLKDKQKDETKVKLEIVKLIKIDLKFPGIKLTFFDSEFILEGEKSFKYIGIASGKGGVGKSTVTAQLAFAMSRIGYRVGVIDADMYGASIPAILEIPIKPINQTSDEKMIPLAIHGIEVVSTEFFMPKDKPLMWRGPMLGKMLAHYFSGVAWHADTDVIFIDMPPGTGDVALDINKFAPKSEILVVTTPHPNAAAVAVKAGLGAQQIGHDVLGVIENMSYLQLENQDNPLYIFGQGGGEIVAKTLGVPLFGRIPIGQPEQGFIHLEGPIFEAYIAIAKKIMEHTHE
jgi:ATP-binding protein involved in chromosome partitioning